MARTYTPQHQLSKYAAHDTTWDIGYNDTMDRLDSLVFTHFGWDPETTTGLTYGYEGAMLIVAGVPTTVAAGTVALTDNAINYVERTSSGTVSANTTSFTSGFIPLATVQTVAGAITGIVDKRPLDASTATLQNLFDRVKVGATTVTASSATTLLEIIAGTNVTLAADNTAKTVTINAASGLAFGSAIPVAGGAGAVGIAVGASHEDHVHPFSASSPLTYNTGTGALAIQVANTSQPGYLSNADWNTFNSKQAALGYTAADDSNTVHQTGNETVGGNKTLTGVLTLAVGSTTLQPAKFQAGVLLTTPVAHSIEWDGSYGYLTQSAGPTRKQLAYADGTGASGTWGISISGNAATVTTNANLTGDVTSSGNATTIGANKVTLGMMATVATASFLGRTAAGTGNVEALTATQATALLNNVVGDSGTGGTKGLVPAPGAGDSVAAKFLKADGTWAVPMGTGFTNPMTTLGDTIYGGAAGVGTRLAGNTTSNKQFLTQTGTGAISAAPAWGVLAADDYPAFVGDSGTGGTRGAVPAPATGDATKYLKGDGTWAAVPALSDGDKGDITVSASGATWTIDNSAVTLAKLADVATATVFYRKTVATGAPEVQTLATLKTDLGLTGTNSGDQTITLTGDVTGSGTGSFATTVADNAITLAKMATVATQTFLGRTTAATGNVEALTVTQATALLNAMVGDSGAGGTKGLVPAPTTGDATKYLKGDGTWATVPALADGDKGDITVSASGATWTIDAGVVTLGKMENRATATFLGRNTAGTGSPEELSVATAKTMLGLTGTNSGDQTITLTGDVTGSGTGSFAATVANNAITLAKMATVATQTFLGRTTAATGNVEALTVTQATALLNAMVGDAGSGGTKGLVPAPATGDASKYLKGDGTWATVPALADGDKGDITVSASGATWTIDNSTITLAKMADVATATVFYRKTAATGAPEVQTLATLKTDLGLTGTNSGDQTITLTGDVTGTGTGSFAATVANNAITLAKMAQVATATFLGRTTAATGDVEALTATQATALLNNMVGDAGAGGTKGLVPAPAIGDSTKYLKGDGTWATPAGGGGSPGGADKQIQYNNAGAFGGEAGFEYDAATNQVTVPGITITEDIALTGDISPTQLTGNQNNYSPTNFATASVLRLTSDAARYITGLGAGSDGLLKTLVNVGSFNIILQHDNTSSLAANRLVFPTSGDYTLTPNASITLMYDGTTSRWRPWSQTGSSSWTDWDVNIPPVSPSAYDDEFNVVGTSINTTLWANRPNWSGLTASDVNSTITEALYAVDPVTGSTATYLIRAALQSLPAGDFTIVTSIDVPNVPLNNQRIGLVLTDNATAGAGTQILGSICNVSAAAQGVRAIAEKFTNYNTYSSAPVGQYDVPCLAKYFLRFVRSSTTYYFGHSIDGVRWFDTSFTPGITPTHFGIGVNSAAGAGYGDSKYAFRWFRYSSTPFYQFGDVKTYNSVVGQPGADGAAGSTSDIFYFQNFL